MFKCSTDKEKLQAAKVLDLLYQHGKMPGKYGSRFAGPHLGTWKGLPLTHLGQIDAQFTRFISMPAEISRSTDLGDSIMTAIVLAPLTGRAVTFTDLGRLRVQECERVLALRNELTKCGARVIEEGDTLRIEPGELHGAEIETYQDHRMVMCFALLGLKVSGMRLRNPTCVKKTFPNFFQKLAAAPPNGVGVEIRAASGAVLERNDLFAE